MLARAALLKFENFEEAGFSPAAISPALRWEFLKKATARHKITDRGVLLDRAALSLDAMTERAQEFAALIKGARIINVCLKDRKTASDKIDNEYGGDVTQLCDAVRCTVMIPADNVEICRAALALHDSTCAVKDLIETPSKTGLAIINAKLALRNAMVGEIQFVTPNMYSAMQQTHDKYKQIDRLVTQFADTAIPLEEANKIKALRMDCVDIHATAVHLDGLNRFVDKGTGRAHPPLALNN